MTAGILPALLPATDTVLELSAGYAAGGEVGFRGSSIGLLPALSHYYLEQEGLHEVLLIGADTADPGRNLTRLGHTRQELLD